MLRTVVSNWTIAVLQILILIQLTPVQIRALGLDVNGVWLTIASLTSVVGLLILGVPMASVRFITQHVARKDLTAVNRAISACLGTCLMLGGVALLAGAALAIPFERAYLGSPEWQALGDHVRSEARAAYWLSVVQVALGFSAQLPFGILDAHNEFAARNGVKLVGLLARVVLIVGVLRIHPSLVLLALIQVTCMVAELSTALFLIRRRCPGVRFGLLGFRFGDARAILGFSVFVLLLNMGSQLAFRSDVLVIGAYLPPEQGTFFDIGNKFFAPLTEVLLGVGLVIMPMATRLTATRELGKLREIFLKWSKISLSVALLVGVYLIVLGPEVIAWWMGPALAARSGLVTQVLMVSFIAFLPVRTVAVPMLVGMGKPRAPAACMLGMGLLNLALSLLLVRPLGIVGVALGTAIPNVLFACGMIFLACAEAGVPLGRYVRYVCVRAVLGALPALGLLVGLKHGLHLFPHTAPRAELLVLLALSGFGMVALSAIIGALFVWRHDPYLDLAERIEGALPARMRAHFGHGHAPAPRSAA